MNRTSFRWFAGAFLVGAAIPLLAGMSGHIKDLKLQMGRATFEGASAWGVLSAQCGVCFGLVGLCCGALKRHQFRKTNFQESI